MKIYVDEERLLTLEEKVRTLESVSPMKEYRNPEALGMNDENTLTEIILAMPADSTLSFWINATTAFPVVYNEVLQAVDALCPQISHAYGNMVITRLSNIWKIRWQAYNSNAELVNTYSLTNNVGFTGWSVAVPYAEGTP